MGDRLGTPGAIDSYLQGSDAYFERNCEGPTAHTVGAIENVLISKDEGDILELEPKKNFKIDAVVIEQFQFPQTSSKFSARLFFERKLL